MPIVRLDGLDLHHRDSGGEGMPVVLIHGFPFDSDLWDPQFAELSARYRLVAPDLRGFGRSSPPTSRDGYTIGAFADDVAALLDHLEVPHVVLVGLSMGGYIAFEFLRHHPQRVSGLVLADTRADADTDEVRARRTRQQRQVEDVGTNELTETMIEGLLSETTRRAAPEVVAHLRAVMDQRPEAWIGGLEAMKLRHDSTDLLSEITVPALIVVGEHDAIAPPDVARAMSDRIPGGRLVVVEGAGHVANLEAPREFNAALTTFLDGL